MSDASCDLLWQVEAVHDGRLASTPSILEHRSRCAACRHEHERLESTGRALRAEAEGRADELRLARLRRRMLESVERGRLRGGAHALGTSSRIGAAALLATCAAVVAVAVWRKPDETRLRAVLHSTQPVRFEHRFVRDDEVITLVDGSLDVTVLRGPGRPVQVRVPDGVIVDRGTKFRVTVRERRTIELDVTEGAIEFRRVDGTRLLLRAGDLWREPKPAIETRVANSPPLVAPRETAAPERAPVRDRSSRTAAIPPIDRAVSVVAQEDHASEDALYLEAVRRSRHGDHEAARAVAERYLEAFPVGFRAAELRTLLERMESHPTGGSD